MNNNHNNLKKEQKKQKNLKTKLDFRSLNMKISKNIISLSG